MSPAIAQPGQRPNARRRICAHISLACASAVMLSALAAAPASAATFTVENVSGEGPGSVREAIAAANADPAPDLIEFAPEVRGTVEVDQGALPIESAMTIDGPGASALAISGRGQNRVFDVRPGVNATISGLTITGGSGEFQGGDGTRAGPNGIGGGLLNAGTLRLVLVTVTGNRAQGASGSRLGGDASGGGISNTGSLTLEGSTVSDNTARAGPGVLGGDALGGGIDNTGSLVLSGSTVSGNTATGADAYGTTGTGGDAVGGGIRNSGAATATIGASTISGNAAVAGRGGEIGQFVSLQGWAFGGGVLNGNLTAAPAADESVNPVQDGAPGIVTLTAVTLTGNRVASLRTPSGYRADEANLSGGATLTSTIVGDPRGAMSCGRAVSGGYNLDSDGSCKLGKPTDQSGKDPKLGPLRDNGGPTSTHAIPFGSPATDQGISAGMTVDQRGLGRPIRFTELPKPGGGDGSDVGAFELQARGLGQAPIVGSVEPRRLPAGARSCLRATATYPAGQPIRGVLVRFAGESKRTDRRGKARLCVRPHRPGSRPVKLTKRGLEDDRLEMRITPARR